MSFSFSFVFFMYQLTISIIFRFYLCSEDVRSAGLGGEDENGPKRRQMHCLDPRYAFLCIFYVLTNIFYSI